MPGISELSKASKDEMVTTLAALLLHDAGAEVTGDKIAEVISASGNDVEKYWPALFAGLLSKVDVDELIKSSTGPGSGGGGGGGGAAPAAGGGGGDAPAEKKEEKKKEEPAEIDVGGGDLFGGGGGGY